MNPISIGWIGLGKMGIPMTAQLIKAGYPLTVYNRSKDKEAPLREMGASVASTPAALIQQCEIIILMVSDDNATKDIFTGKDGLLSVQASGKLIINMSTISPSISKQFAAELKRHGNDYLDAPVSGSVKQAQDAQLVTVVGGEKTAYDKAKPVLDTMGKLTMHVGGVGAGNITKLAINTLLGFHTLGFAETIKFAQKNDVNIETLTTLINNSALGNAFMKIKGEAILQNNFAPAFALKQIAKDLGLAKAEGLNTPLGTVAYETFKTAADQYGEEDMIAVIKALKE